MKAEDFYISNFRSKFNPCFKENRKIEQYTFDDMVEFAERYHEAMKKDLLADFAYYCNSFNIENNDILDEDIDNFLAGR